MEVVEKEKETIKEVPAGYYYDKYGCYDECGYGRYGRYGTTPFASKGIAGTGLGLGIAGTALGLLALSRNGRGIGLFGNSGAPENVNINTTSLSGSNGVSRPTAFQTWHKECDDVLALTNEMWGLKIGTMNNAKDYEIHFLTTTINDPIPSGIIKVKNRISDFIALGGKLILSDPTVATGELLKEITKEIVQQDISRMKAVEELMEVRRV